MHITFGASHRLGQGDNDDIERCASTGKSVGPGPSDDAVQLKCGLV